MNTPKLPPLPKPDTHCFDEDTGKDVWSHSPEQMQAYALAAIEALWAQLGQGVPTDEQIMATVQQKGFGFSQSRPLAQQWDQVCELIRVVVRERNTHPAPQQIGQCDMQIRVLFECVENGVTGTTSAPVKRVEWEDDGTLTAVLDYWPPPAPKQKPLTDEQSRELAEQHYVCSPWYDTNPASVIGSRQWCVYWDGWRAAIGIKGE